MFARVKKSGQYQYLQIVENNKVKGQVKQRVIATVGRLDHLQEKGRVETLIRSLSRYSEKAMLILTGHSDPDALTIKIGPALIFERLWEQTGIKKALQRLLKARRFEFDVERAVFLTVLHRLMTSVPTGIAIAGEEITPLPVPTRLNFIIFTVRWRFWESNLRTKPLLPIWRPGATRT